MRSTAARGQRVAVALAHARLEHEAAQVLLLVQAVRAVEARDQLAAERDLDVAALGDLQRRLDRAREVARTTPPSRRCDFR